MTAIIDDRVAELERANAELQRQLDERTAERDEALAQQAATAEVLQVINSSPGDLAPVFDAMLEKATRLCEAAFGVLHIYDGERFHPVSTLGVPGAYADYLKRDPPEFGPGTGPARTLAGERVVHIVNMIDTETYRAGEPNRRAIVDLGGARTALGVPLLKDEVVLGHFTIYRQQVRPFTEKQIALLQNFAAQAVIAMENARLLTETREALEQQTATAEVLGVINSSPGDLAPVFDAMLDRARRLCEAAFGVLWAYEGGAFRAAVVHGAPPAFVEFVRQPMLPPYHPGSGLAHVLQGDDFTIHEDMAAEDIYRVGNPLRRAIVDLGGARSTVTMSLRKDKTLLGAFTIFRQEVRPFTDKQIALLQNFAAQAVIAMDNARLLTETREALEQQTATAEVLQVINSSPGDLAPVFDAMLEKALTLCGAAFGVFWTRDGESFRAVVLRRVPAAFADLLAKEPYRPEPGSGHERLMRGEPFVQVEDAAAEAQIGPVRQALVEQGGARSLIAVPLRKDGAVLGVISAYRQEVRPFTDKQIALVQNFA